MNLEQMSAFEREKALRDQSKAAREEGQQAIDKAQAGQAQPQDLPGVRSSGLVRYMPPDEKKAFFDALRDAAKTEEDQ